MILQVKEKKNEIHKSNSKASLELNSSVNRQSVVRSSQVGEQISQVASKAKSRSKDPLNADTGSLIISSCDQPRFDTKNNTFYKYVYLRNKFMPYKNKQKTELS